jgi:hypothetical protein
LASKILILSLREAIDASSPPTLVISGIRDRNINVVQIKTFNIHRNITMIPNKSQSPSSTPTNNRAVNRMGRVIIIVHVEEVVLGGHELSLHQKNNVRLVVVDELFECSYCPGVPKPLTVPRKNFHGCGLACLAVPTLCCSSIFCLLI